MQTRRAAALDKHEPRAFHSHLGLGKSSSEEHALNSASPLGVLAVGALLVSGCGGSSGGSSDGSSGGSSGQGSSILAEDDFSDPGSGWREASDDSVLLEYADGGYRILVKSPGRQDSRLTFGSPDNPHSVGAVSVEADATERAGPYSSGAGEEFEFHGVACWGASAQSDRLAFAYKFVLTPVGHYGILKDTQGSHGLETLAEGDGDFGGYGKTNRIRGECVAGGDRPTSLVLSIDGEKIAEASDPDGPARFPAIGLAVETSAAGTDVLFDNVLARNPLVPEASTPGPTPESRVDTSSEPPPQSQAGTSSERSAPTACKKDGIRYSGTTAQGGEVCFTLNPDGTRLLELGYAFVRADQCPEMRTGLVYSSGDGGPSVTRNQIRSSGFTGTIQGAEASGILQDWDVCRERTVAWRAHRVP